MAGISIYKASAGSGKTYQLTEEYLKLIFTEGTRFTSILAVTFTNKATAEMRERILLELYKLANNELSNHHEALVKHTGLLPEQLIKKANYLLQNILQNYSRFNISTIDSFFQRILKAFTHEIGLNAGFNIELNAKPIIEKAVDGLFDDIQETKELKVWLEEYAFNKIKEGNSWDIHKDLIEFTNSSFSEVFYSFDEAHMGAISNLDVFVKLKAQLSEITTRFIKTTNAFGEQFYKQIRLAGLEIDDFSNKKSGVAGYFVLKMRHATANSFDLPGVRVLKAANSPDGIIDWVAKTAPKKEQIQQCVNAHLQKITHDFIAFCNENAVHFFSAVQVQKNLSVFAVLVEVFKRVLNYCNTNNMFLLPLASPFLAKIIADDDAPFIYEKTGDYLQHFMIDEFQDTSQLQWKNFSPLVTNGIAQGYSSLVVGDVKQAIYRWRNSDWGLLAYGLNNQFKGLGVNQFSLDNNWRSAKNVVEFNNWCFQKASLALSNAFEDDDATKIISDIYANASQKVPPVNKDSVGFVQVRYFDADTEYDSQALQAMVESINSLYEKGYRPHDMAILVRKNSEGAKVARYLMEEQKVHPEKAERYRFVSNDSVFLGSSDSILLIVSVMAFLNNPDSLIFKARILQLFYTQKHNIQQASHTLASIQLTNTEDFLSALPTEFKNSIEAFRYMTLVDLSFHLIRIFLFEPLKESGKIQYNQAFIHAFQDAVLNFTTKNGNDIAGFIEWWDTKGFETPVNLSDSQNAIRIITIHKSKGLEFNAVIIPFANWKLEPRDVQLWCSSNQAPFNSFNLLPIKYSSALKNTYFASYYNTERLKSVIDNLNLLYVAFTRAESALYVFSSQKAPNVKNTNASLKTVADLLSYVISPENTNNEFNNSKTEWTNEDTCFELGAISKITIHEKEREVVVSEPYSNFGVLNRQLKIRLQGKDIFESEDKAALKLLRNGSLYHKIFEFVKYKADIPNAVSKALALGLISANQQTEVQQLINNFISQSKVDNWYDTQWKVITEKSILMSNNELKRPDRVIENADTVIVIDYKFTESEKEIHIKQVADYVKAISEMTTKTVIGYLWYVYMQKKITVK